MRRDKKRREEKRREEKSRRGWVPNNTLEGHILSYLLPLICPHHLLSACHQLGTKPSTHKLWGTFKLQTITSPSAQENGNG
jgi:hypothetical protein